MDEPHPRGAVGCAIWAHVGGRRRRRHLRHRRLRQHLLPGRVGERRRRCAGRTTSEWVLKGRYGGYPGRTRGTRGVPGGGIGLLAGGNNTVPTGYQRGTNVEPTRNQRGTNAEFSRGSRGVLGGTAEILGPQGGLRDSPELLKRHTRIPRGTRGCSRGTLGASGGVFALERHSNGCGVACSKSYSEGYSGVLGGHAADTHGVLRGLVRLRCVHWGTHARVLAALVVSKQTPFSSAYQSLRTKSAQSAHTFTQSPSGARRHRADWTSSAGVALSPPCDC